MRGLVVCALLLAGCSEDGGAPPSGQGGAAGAGGTAGAAGDAGTSGAAGSAGTTSGCTVPSEQMIDPLAASEIVIIGDPGAPLGVFDVSPVYPAGAPGGAMSYSAVVAKNDISTRIALSPDQGASWTHVAEANSAVDVTVTTPPSSPRCPGGSCSGRLIHEVSSLVFDPTDVATRRWKLYAHSYVVLGAEDLAYDWGYISAFAAPEPQGPWTFEGKAIGWNGEATLSSEGAWSLASDVPELGDCVALTEPGALVMPNGVIQLAAGCATAAQAIRIVVFDSADHGKSFSYRGVLLDGQDALCTGGATPQYNAAQPFFAGGKQYLLATTTGNVQPSFVGYAGCHLFEMEAVGGTTVLREPDGDPIALSAFDATQQRFNGACAYAEGATAMGLAISILRLELQPKIFHTYATKEPLP